MVQCKRNINEASLCKKYTQSVNCKNKKKKQQQKLHFSSRTYIICMQTYKSEYNVQNDYMSSDMQNTKTSLPEKFRPALECDKSGQSLSISV